MIYILLLQKFAEEIFDLRLKRANLASKSDIANFINKIDFGNKLKDITSIKNELNKLSKKVRAISAKDIVSFLTEYTLQAIMDQKICLFINQHLT